MHNLIWKEFEVIECLGVLPKTDEFETSHYFKVEKNGLILEISIWQYESLIAVSIYQLKNSNPFLTFWFVVRDKIRYINDKRGSFLEFSDFLIVKNRAYYLEENKLFEELNSSTKLNLEITVEPEISFRII